MCHTSFTQFKIIVNEYDVTEIRDRGTSLFGAFSSSVHLRWLVSYLMVIWTFGPGIPKNVLFVLLGSECSAFSLID